MGISALIDAGDQTLSKVLRLTRCPHCGIAKPLLPRVHEHVQFRMMDGHLSRPWSVHACTNCGSLVTARGGGGGSPAIIDLIFPDARGAHEDLPDAARTYLQQAYDTLAAPDAAAVMAGSAVDAMLKALGYNDGSLYHRIDQALADKVLTQGMADWAHNVRLGSNRPRHSDADQPHVSPLEAQQSVEFAEALGNFLFVLTARIQRGLAATKK